MVRFFYISIITALVLISACESDYSFRGDASSITFSADTLSFDTIFAGRATSTGRLMVYNTSGEDLTIDRIRLSGSSSSFFNVNINGASGTEASDIRLRSGDSLYLFVNVLVPFSDKAYLTAEDDVIVEAGAYKWSAKLWACALSARRLSGELYSDSVLTSDIPYLVEGTFTVDSVSTLTVSEGTTIYCADDSRINVEGRLVTNGSALQPVVFRCTRLDDFYYDIPGQWHGIQLMLASGRADLHHTEIANAISAFTADSATTANLDAVYLRDAKRHCLLTYDASVNVTNSIIANSGESLVMVYGGNVRIVHSDIVGYYRWDSRSDAAVKVVAGEGYPQLSMFEMGNSVVVGNQSDEINLDDGVTADNCLFSHCYLRFGTKWKEDTDSRFDAVIVGKEPEFVDRAECDYHLTDKSPLIGAGLDSYADIAPYDYEGSLRRIDDSVDIGALEYAPEVDNDSNNDSSNN